MGKENIETPEEKRDRELVEAMAINIASLAKRVRELMNGPLNRRALITLLTHSSGQSRATVVKVLESLENMEKDWLNDRPVELKNGTRAIRGDKG